jgi:hypothetical protein
VSPFRRGNNARDRQAARDNSQIHGEFISAGKELARSIERIDDNDAAGEVSRCRRIDRLFSHHRCLRQDPGEAVQDQPFGRLIGRSHRGLVGLQTSDRRGRRCRPDLGARTNNERGQIVHHLPRLHGRNVGSWSQYRVLSPCGSPWRLSKCGVSRQ